MLYKILKILSITFFGGFVLHLEGAARITPNNSQQTEITQIASGNAKQTDDTQYRATFAMLAHGKLTPGLTPINTSEEARKKLLLAVLKNQNLREFITASPRPNSTSFLSYENSLLALEVERDISRKYKGRFVRYQADLTDRFGRIMQHNPMHNDVQLANTIYFLRKDRNKLYLDQITQKEIKSFAIATLSEAWLKKYCPVKEINCQHKSCHASITAWSLYQEKETLYELFVGVNFDICYINEIDGSQHVCNPRLLVKFTIDTTQSKNTSLVPQILLVRQTECHGPLPLRRDQSSDIPKAIYNRLNRISSITHSAGILRIEWCNLNRSNYPKELILYDIDQLNRLNTTTTATNDSAVIYQRTFPPLSQSKTYHNIILTVEKIIMLECGPTEDNNEDTWCQATVYDNKTYFRLHDQEKASPGKTVYPRMVIKRHSYDRSHKLYVNSEGLFFRNAIDKLECIMLWNNKGDKKTHTLPNYELHKKEEFLKKIFEAQTAEDYSKVRILEADNGKFFVGVEERDDDLTVTLHRWVVSPDLVQDLVPQNPLLGAHSDEVVTIQKVLDLFHTHKANFWNTMLLMRNLSASTREKLEKYFAQHNELILVKAILARFHASQGPSHTELMNKVSESTQNRLKEYFTKFEAKHGKKPETSPQKKSYLRRFSDKLSSQNPFVLLGKLACTAAVGTLAIRYMRKKISLPTLIHHKKKQPTIAL